MTETNGFLNFNTPEDYLAYQDRLIYNWERYHQYKHLSGGTMLSETYRQTGRTYSALKCAVELSKRSDVKSILFVTHNFKQAKYLLSYPLVKDLLRCWLDKIIFVSYEGLVNYLIGKKQNPDYVIYDHQVFETCVPDFIIKSEPRTPAEEAYKRVYGVYPMTDVGDGYWECFLQGFEAAQKND
jgi:hypothetical protein